ncbi:MAG: ABC transporter permease [Clostridia bacterium]|nr:ABC transporter permease [Clostridia bacterium]
MTKNEMSGFRSVSTSEHKLFDLHIKETLKYRDLIMLFVKRNFIADYKQTILGPLWAIINPLFNTFVFAFIFGELAGLTTADVPGDYLLPSFLFYLSGNICWSYFSSTLNATSNTFISNSGTMGKVYYPRLVAPVSTAFSGLISFGIQIVMFFMVWGYHLIAGGTSISVTPKLLLLPLCILQMMILSTGFGIIISALTTKYRDLVKLVALLLSVWRYFSPVAYGLQLVPEKHQFLYMLNPFSSIVTTFRYSMFGFGYFDIASYLISWAISLTLFFIGLILFSRIERTFMDTI